MFELQNVEKRYPGVHVLKGVDFRIGDGEIVGLVGENGAGKSTLMKIIYGAVRHDAGNVLVDGVPVSFSNPRDAMKMGVGMVYQEQSLIPNLTVMENIFLGFEKPFVRFGAIKWKKMAEAAGKQLRKVKLDIDPAMITSKLTFSQRQLVELAKVLTLEERVEGKLVILLDEPTSVLSKEEIDLLFGLVRELRGRASFIFVSHRLDEIVTLSDRIYVLKDGAVVDVMNSAEADIETIQKKMVGRDVNHEYYREDKQRPYDDGHVLLELDHVTIAGRGNDVSLNLHAGEVLALVGVEGSGREPVLRTIFGMKKPEKGTISIRGIPVRSFSASESVSHGVGYVPRERKIEGIASGMNVFENMTLSQMRNYSKSGVLRIPAERELARDWIRRLSIRVASENSDCGNLSGGNQQKVVLAKWRSSGSEIILLDHPTRGLDIGAKEDVYEMIRDMSADGVGIILVADTLEEAIGLSHTIAVIKDGEIRKWFNCQPGSKPSPYDLIRYMV
ncbi:sugar ABC transporter ATP-binding protein [Acetobacter oeni]|uniref:ABC transporter ATP-binding protein n=1 Tax=Acetobacter oeni TaxID=304077 RepID=A0A511XM91_9PROT|nr:sugar ABC transporter ATP-binding protein [Acetobacter oeni]MBB3884060.1 ribose transport system ATP-binding protein [Acetobacter oeni]NHO19996.1 ATP-binding cassette domain-containing protein [Acetobacter oeni]GBR08517.1 sugar ABC transporter ATP-binding protein [Acetobacter oeni LMG 21952]GEN64046.1 ABC transporter ATP-binding protein [Acetobacter oeni]